MQSYSGQTDRLTYRYADQYYWRQNKHFKRNNMLWVHSTAEHNVGSTINKDTNKVSS